MINRLNGVQVTKKGVYAFETEADKKASRLYWGLVAKAYKFLEDVEIELV